MSLHLANVTEGDVWNLVVDTGNPSNFAERYNVNGFFENEEMEEDGEGIRTERVEFVANGFAYSVQTTNRVQVEDKRKMYRRWEGRPEVTMIEMQRCVIRLTLDYVNPAS